MYLHIRRVAFLLMLALALVACQPAPDAISDADQVATIVAATMAAEQPDEAAASPTPDSPTEEAAAPATYGACANSGTATVAYLKDGNVWLWVQGSDAIALTDSGDVADLDLSDDGCRVAYSRQMPNPNYDPNAEVFSGETYTEMWVISSDGSNNQVLVGWEFLSSLPAFDAQTTMGVYEYAWLPGSHSLAVGTKAVTYGLALSDDIHIVDANSANINTLLPAGQGGQFSVSPDGSRIAFSTPTSINVINADGSGLQTELVSFPMVLTYSEYQYYPPIYWGQASDQMMVAIPPEEGLGGPVDGIYPETALWLIPLDGTDPWQAGSVQNVWLALSQVRFSPDISRIAYLRPLGQPEENRYELVIAFSNGSNESLNLEENRITIGAWSPDSNQLIYWYEGGDGRPMIYLANAADGSTQPGDGLTQFQANVAYFQWLDATAYVQALYRGADNFIELGLINLDGSGVIIDAYQSSTPSFDVAAP